MGTGQWSRWRWLESLSDRDLEFIAPGRADALRRDPDLVQSALDDPALFVRLSGDPDALLKVSPTVLFTVFLREAARELAKTRFTMERTGFRQRVAVFDAIDVCAFLSNRVVSDYLGELLASFTRVYSGSTWQRGKRGWRRRRFSELDLRSLEALQATAPPADQFRLDRRIGDVALFLLGVFPDAAHRPRLRAHSPEELTIIGAGRYRRAAVHPLAEASGLKPALERLGSHFTLARKSLEFVSERYLYPQRDAWFPTP